MTLEEISHEALTLDEADRAILADILLASVGDMDDAEYNQVWGEEAYRRLEALENGLEDDISAEDALRELRESLS